MIAVKVINRCRAPKPGFKKNGQPHLQYVVTMFHNIIDYEDSKGTIIAKFVCPGDAHSWAQLIASRGEGHCLTVSND